MRLRGKVALVTGGASGIGQEVALRVAREGADVAVADINSEGGSGVVSDIRGLGRKAVFIKTDVRKSAEVDAMMGNVLRQFGKIDILVNCAGGSARGRSTLFHESSEEVWDYVIELNLKGVRNCCRAVIRPMIDRRYGKIVNIASTTGSGAYPRLADYSAAKAGVIAFSRVLAVEVVGYGVNVNCVSPGPTDTEAMRSEPEEVREHRKKSTGLGRFAKVEEIANAVVFLASDEASFITGQNYHVCGVANLSS